MHHNLSKHTKIITEYMQHVKSYADELCLMNIPYETNELTLKIIHGLSGKDDSLSFAIKACETSLLFDELHEELIAIEA